ncbi:cysteine desulfurase NifS [Candidatus Falkowbacteria bacterium CG_4_10_14_0_2_um_filter_36_22]|uniref:cysteine desulfurase n=2 Tax=Candidatus Falkowiibacteriota TaxID=1752728 RepID=A0A1J4T5K4_9BACT|nr:MAG: hypothetical protein AUJ27_03060 [Candidatus Falkowbacteria bacterium CG1_02_37_44]PIV50237.1 MAG: cysteine desulfurase NifS [Candidatus Falkowbacteria bacterium CG02_land_8_20_14_3_00_36_14]PIX11804.1 MAG: cysteine desulfurase NifS [Candidatus Falkowbacteria bacterium CG_4_8_14_3_um_filter_36_11]PJA10931.1 MAG: cysteine desulfurase NifS [Candidatus Falkowbacteria bacterium CG_4_10_14_0_2_um_filter_36_22]
MKIYLDYSATTPVDKSVVKAMFPYYSNKFGNPSSLHSFGQEAVKGVDRAREQIAWLLNCQANEIVFTSGATESDNLAIKGLIKALLKKDKNKKYHIITSAIEHSAVLETCAELEREGIEVTYLPVGKNGLIDINGLKKSIKNNTVLISIMYANSEVGCIEPINDIGKIINKINEKRLKEWKNISPKSRGDKPHEIYFHTDAVQAINYVNCDVKYNFIDLLSLSGHKIYGPKGIGVLYVRSGVPLSALQLGGHHENNIRSGTLNVPGIVGLGSAASLINKSNHVNINKIIAGRRDRLVVGIIKNIPEVILNTDRSISTPSHAHFSFLGVEGESILISLDLEGIAVSTGSACASGSLKPSHVLLAMGIKEEVAHSSIRFTLGKNTTIGEIDKVIKILPPIIKRLRSMAP